MAKPGRAFVLVLLVLCIALLPSIASCQRKQTTPVDPALLPQTRQSPEPTVEPTVALASAQEIRANLRGDPPTLDPSLASWDATSAVVSLTFDRLFKFDEKLNLIPSVAANVPTVANGGISGDGKVYTIKLRNDSRWSDGKGVTARDFEYSLKRLLDPKLSAEYAPFFYNVEGAKAYNTALGTQQSPVALDDAKLAKLRDAVGIKAVGDYTLQITLAEPRASFPMLLTLMQASPIREDIVKAKGDNWFEEPANYVGNGPFRLTEWAHRDHITLVPNTNYANPRTKLTKITLFMVTDAQTDFAAYLDGEREIVPVPQSQIEAVRNDPALSKQLVISPRMATFALQLNNRKPPFNNPKVRQAFSLAVDRVAFVEKLRRGIGQPAYSWIPPGVPGHDPDLGKQWWFDPAKAQVMLAESGYPGGQGLPPITFEYANTGSNLAYAEFFQSQFRDNLGVEVKLEPLEPAAFSRYINEGRHMIALFGFGGDYPDPDNWLPDFFGVDARLNKAGYVNQDVDELMANAAVELDPKKRAQMWAQAQKIIVDDAPIIFLYFDERFVLVKPYVMNLHMTPVDTNSLPGNRLLEDVYLIRR